MTGITVKGTELLETPPTVTVILRFPAARLLGTAAVTLVSLQEEIDAVAEPKVTKLAPCVAPKPAPEMVMGVPPGPRGWERLLMDGADCAWV